MQEEEEASGLRDLSSRGKSQLDMSLQSGPGQRPGISDPQDAETGGLLEPRELRARRLVRTGPALFAGREENV